MSFVVIVNGVPVVLDPRRRVRGIPSASFCDDCRAVSEDAPACENCGALTRRQCQRCGQRICLGCAKVHPVREYGTPPELWQPCKRGAS